MRAAVIPESKKREPSPIAFPFLWCGVDGAIFLRRYSDENRTSDPRGDLFAYSFRQELIMTHAAHVDGVSDDKAWAMRLPSGKSVTIGND